MSIRVGIIFSLAKSSTTRYKNIYFSEILYIFSNIYMRRVVPILMSNSDIVRDSWFLRDFATGFHQDRRIIGPGWFRRTVVMRDWEHVLHVYVISENIG